MDEASLLIMGVTAGLFLFVTTATGCYLIAAGFAGGKTEAFCFAAAWFFSSDVESYIS